MSLRRLVLAMLSIPILLIVTSSDAHAHIRLESSAPSHGEVVTELPSALRLVFSERVQLALTSVVLLGPQGDTLALARLRTDDTGMQVVVDVLGAPSAGEFVIVWRTVSADGHPVSGRIAFMLELPEAATDTAAGPTQAVPPGGDPPPSVEGPGARQLDGMQPPPTGFHVRSPLFVAIRWVGYLALVGMFGAAVFVALLLPGVTARAPAWRGPDLEAAWRARRWGVLASVVFLLAAVARLLAQGTALTGPLEVDIDVLNAVVLDSAWGQAWIAQVASGFLMAIFLAGAERSWGRVGALLMIIAVAVASGAAGHAVTTPWPAALVLAHAAHLVAVGVWFGGLAMILLAALPAARTAGGGLAARMAAMVNRFSPIALACGALVMLTGVLAAAVHLGGVRELWESDYGQVLIIKLLLFAVVLGFGAWNWRRMRPTLASSSDAAPLRTTGGTELAFSTFILLVTSLLVATPPTA